MTTTQTIRSATEWAGSSYASEAQATRACLLGWLSGGTGLLSRVQRDASPANLATALYADEDGLRWISLGADEDGQPVVEGPYRCDEAEAESVIADLQAEAEAELLAADEARRDAASEHPIDGSR